MTPDPNPLVPVAAADRLAAGHRLARTITAHGGRTYFLAAHLLPPQRRAAVFALYAFARIVDDVVDGTVDGNVTGGVPSAGGPRPTRPDAARRLDEIAAALHATLAVDRSTDPSGPVDTDDRLATILPVLHETVLRYEIAPHTFDAFLRSMRMDVPGTAEFTDRYRTFDELARYTYGSAAVIGLQLLTVLGADPTPSTAAAAAALGEAFQLTNFLRDVAEDLDRDRIYLPTDELAAFGVDEAALRADRLAGRTSTPLRRALAHLIAVNRDQYRRAWPGIAALPGYSAPAITAAATTYHDILTAIEDCDYAVLDHRVIVTRRRRLARVAAATLRMPAPAPGG
ncbi:phytoene/squalene synthase family protein [Gordonia sp. ABSL1-1]|uniref:phytoene/squalene synthase family protein n=1 Tax=Gordonia sp. ABSL1-1 TaxID=3053923 RepID=UPI0025739FA8|nr:phytoene/squalene synthase family protein [Gordonia sp. ABSL1-1]MDL9937387.1 phytoene/squalene synthase family protein [Gordonia sp. ABSL1-1]